MTLGRQGHAVCHGGKIGPCHWRSLRLRSTRSSRWKYRLPFTDGFFRWVSNSHAINAFGNAVQRCLGSLELALIRGITDPPTVGWLAHDFRFFLIWFFRKKREVGEKFHVFRAKGCLKNTCWTCFAPQASSSWVFDWPLFFQFARGKLLRVDSHFALLVELYVPGACSKKIRAPKFSLSKWRYGKPYKASFFGCGDSPYKKSYIHFYIVVRIPLFF